MKCWAVESFESRSRHIKVLANLLKNKINYALIMAGRKVFDKKAHKQYKKIFKELFRIPSFEKMVNKIHFISGKPWFLKTFPIKFEAQDFLF